MLASTFSRLTSLAACLTGEGGGGGGGGGGDRKREREERGRNEKGLENHVSFRRTQINLGQTQC